MIPPNLEPTLQLSSNRVRRLVEGGYAEEAHRRDVVDPHGT